MAGKRETGGDKWLDTRNDGNQILDNEGHVLTNLSFDFTLEAMYKHQKNLRKSYNHICIFGKITEHCSFQQDQTL